MALTKESYEALEDVVGPEYISQDPAIQETYNQVWGNKLVFGEKWSTRRLQCFCQEVQKKCKLS